MKKLTVWKVAYILEISADTLLRWEKKGKIPEAKRNPMNGWREWTETEVAQIKDKINNNCPSLR